MAFYNELKNHIEAKVPAIYIETTEWERFEAELKHVCENTNKKAKFWDPVSGLDNDPTDFVKDLIPKIKDSKEVKWDITVIEYADRYLREDPDPAIHLSSLIRKLRDLKHQIIVVAPTLCLPDAIKNEFAIIDFPLPKRDDIKKIFNAIEKDFDISTDKADEILDSVKGLSTTEIRNAFAKIAAKKGKITAEEIPDLTKEKGQIIKKSGYLEYINADIKMEQIGGLDNLKKWLEQRKIAFGAKARDKKLQTPKGVMLLGIPGTGKSLSAKAIASIWKMPLLRLDMAKIFGGLVGESESNMRNTIKVAESLEPCVLWVDEIEKGLSGGQGGERDGGTSTRVLGTFLTWMQEKQKEVFVFATANDISKLPSELLRKGRFDEIFFVDLPNKDTRKKIFQIHLNLISQGDTQITDELLKTTEGHSGAEIESIVHEAHFSAHNENADQQKKISITAAHLLKATKQIVPLARTMKENIEGLRKWSETRCRKASNAIPPEITESTEPKLPQESTNIFMKN